MAIPAPRWDLLGEGKERFLGCTTAGLTGEDDMRPLPLASAPSGSSEPTRARSQRSIPALHPARCPGAPLSLLFPCFGAPPRGEWCEPQVWPAGQTNSGRGGKRRGGRAGRDGTGLAAGASPGAKRAERPPREIEVPRPRPRRGEERQALPVLPASPAGRRIGGGGR